MSEHDASVHIQAEAAMIRKHSPLMKCTWEGENMVDSRIIVSTTHSDYFPCKNLLILVCSFGFLFLFLFYDFDTVFI